MRIVSIVTVATAAQAALALTRGLGRRWPPGRYGWHLRKRPPGPPGRRNMCYGYNNSTTASAPRPAVQAPVHSPSAEVGGVVQLFEALQAGVEPFPGYRLRHLLGRGGYADVWEADSPSGQPVALKFMRVDDTHAAGQEVRAIQSMKRLHHPYLIQMDQVWTIPGYVVFSMELAEGSLHDLLQAYYCEYGTAIKPQRVCVYLAQVAEAIDFLNVR